MTLRWTWVTLGQRQASDAGWEEASNARAIGGGRSGGHVELNSTINHSKQGHNQTMYSQMSIESSCTKSTIDSNTLKPSGIYLEAYTCMKLPRRSSVRERVTWIGWAIARVLASAVERVE